MNKMLLFFIFIFWNTLLYSQNVVIDGVTFSADGKILINYSTNKSVEEYSVPEGVEVISENAFRNAQVNKLILPFTLNTIGNLAFQDCWMLETITWKNFPKEIGRYIFFGSGISSFQTLEDSKNCIAIDGILFSKDEKTLLCFPRLKEPAIVPEGTEIIGVSAFESGEMSKVILPKSITKIEDNAFWMAMHVPTRFMDYICLSSVECNALIPPTIIGNPFATPSNINLFVPEKSFDLYRDTPYWQNFYSINGDTGINTTQVGNSFSKVWIESGILYLKSDKEVEAVEIYSANGICIWNECINNRIWKLVTSKLSRGLLLVKVITTDGNQETFKLSN